LIIPYFHIDAFTDRAGTGNPAGVCLLEEWLPDTQMQAIAYENNHSETAFVVGKDDQFQIRWFSPTVEIDLCGHATLAAAKALYSDRRTSAPRLHFQSKSGELLVERQGERLVLDFPAADPLPCQPVPLLAKGLGKVPVELLRSRFLTAVFPDEETVKALQPDFETLKQIDVFAVLATAPGKSSDYVLRCFGPRAGIPEDPVTGSAQCELVPYWSKRLGKKFLHARQISARGGDLFCEMAAPRVKIGGHAIIYLQGSLFSS